MTAPHSFGHPRYPRKDRGNPQSQGSWTAPQRPVTGRTPPESAPPLHHVVQHEHAQPLITGTGRAKASRRPLAQREEKGAPPEQPTGPGGIHFRAHRAGRACQYRPENRPENGPENGSGGTETAERNEYTELKRLVREAGLLEKRPGCYAAHAAANMLMLAGSICTLLTIDLMWVQIVNAAFLSFISVQLSFLGHDLGHKQVFRSNLNNERLGLLVSLLVGINRSWWVQKHNEHHSNPNNDGMDPDVALPAIALSEDQARTKTGAAKLVARHQAFLFYPLLCLEGIVLKASGARHLLKGRVRFPVAEPLIMAGHVAGYLGLVFLALPPWEGLAFIIVNQALTGLYIGSTFAPNHKGMPMLGPGSTLDFLRKQVLTSRNIRPSPVNDYLYGGLNYQIEHHLFPGMPRHCLKRAREIVRPFCRERSIPYHETGVARSQREILSHLHRVGAPLRA